MKIRRPLVMSILEVLTVAAFALHHADTAVAADVIPAEFHGDWVPQAAACDSAVRFRVAGGTVTLINGKDSETFDDIALPTQYFGPDYTGISVVAVPEISSSEPPFQVFFNWNEKKGETQVHIYQEMPGQPHPAYAAVIAAAKKRAERFPLNMTTLKRCPA